MGFGSIFRPITAAIGGAAKIIQGNQYKQRQKGVIGQQYRQDEYQTGLRQANTRESLNESLNARGVLTAGASRGPVGTALQNVAKSGGPKIAGSGVDPFLTASGANSLGPANTLTGGANEQMTDQFALERLGLARGKSEAERANTDQYKSTIGGAISGVFKSLGQDDYGLADAAVGGGRTPLNDQMATYAGANAAANRAAVQPIMGAYNQPVNPSYTASFKGTTIGADQPNYFFNS